MIDSDHQGLQFHGNHSDSNAVQIFNNTGTVTIRQPLDLTPTPPRLCDVPELLSPFFTGRDEDLASIESAFATVHDNAPTRCIIYGIPGQGKTQLALRYASTAFERGRFSYVFWLSGATEEKVNEGFARISSLLHLPRRTDSTQTEPIELAKAWLECYNSEDSPDRRWLLVVDNIAPEVASLLNSRLPRANANGRILLTTRILETARLLGFTNGRKSSLLQLQRLSLDDSAKLLHKRISEEEADPDEEKLISLKAVADAVGCLPLAIMQAGSYMETSSQSAEEFISNYKLEADEILAWEDELSQYDGQPVLPTVLMAVDKLQAISPAAVDLLRVMSYFDPEAIQIRFLQAESEPSSQPTGKRRTSTIDGASKRQYGAARTWQTGSVAFANATSDVSESQATSQEAGDPFETDRLWYLLRSKARLFASLRQVQRLSLAMMRDHDDGKVVWMHDLVQSVLRRKLITPTEREVWLQRAIFLLDRSFRHYNVELPSNWSTCEAFASHGKALSKHVKEVQSQSVNYLTFSDRLALWHMYYGQLAEAETFLTEVVRSRTRLRGTEDIATLISMDNLGSVYRLKGQFHKAESLQTNNVDIWTRVCGPEDSRTLLSMSNLGATLLESGKLDEAERLLQRALNAHRRVLGDDNPYTLKSMDSLAITYKKQGKLLQAQRLGVIATATRSRVLGEEHPETYVGMNNLAHIWKALGWDEAAFKLLGDAHKGLERILGPQHPRTWNCRESLKNFQQDLLRQSEARETEAKDQ